jgi:hypothetical protein
VANQVLLASRSQGSGPAITALDLGVDVAESRRGDRIIATKPVPACRPPAASRATSTSSERERWLCTKLRHLMTLAVSR